MSKRKPKMKKGKAMPPMFGKGKPPPFAMPKAASKGRKKKSSKDKLEDVNF
jgi:hypothetical protein